MSTAAFEVARSIPERVAELNVLVLQAKENFNKDEKLYNALCRAICVLLSSHLEGFIKDLARSVVSDLNYNIQSFSKMPVPLQRTFCKQIAFFELVPAKDVEERIKQLLAFFAKNTVPIDLAAFRYKESSNKNPSAGIVEATLEKIGASSAIAAIAGNQLEVVFTGNLRKTYVIRRELIRYRSTLYRFPYKSLPSTFFPGPMLATKQDKVQTIWHAFLEEMLARRHKIAHGDTLGNDAAWEELQSDIDKLEFLMNGILYSTARAFSAEI